MNIDFTCAKSWETTGDFNMRCELFLEPSHLHSVSLSKVVNRFVALLHRKSFDITVLVNETLVNA